MAQERTGKKISLLLAAVSGVALTGNASAQSTWTGAANGNWGGATWTAGTPNATDAIANVDGTTTGAIRLDGVFSVGTLNLSRGVNFETVTPSFDPARGLTLVTSTGTPTINATGGDVFLFASLYGNQGFTKTGGSRATFRFNLTDQTYTGNVTLAGGTLGINQNGSLGDANNDVVFSANSVLSIEPGSNTGTVTLGAGRSFTLNTGVTGILNTGNANVTAVVQGAIGGAGNLTITGPGTVELQGVNNYAGGTNIASGTLKLSGGNNRIATGTVLSYTGAGRLDLGGNGQTVSRLNPFAGATSTATNGSLTVNGDVNLDVSGTNNTKLDLSGLSSFTYDRGNRAFRVLPVTTTGTTGEVNEVLLAKAGAGANTITTGTVQIGGAAGTSQGDNHEGRLRLGTQNAFNTGSFQVGGFNGKGLVDFQAGLTSPTLTLRGLAGGSSRAATLLVGATSSGVRSGQGVLNLTGGSLDAVVANVIVSQHIAGANNADTSSLTMPGGTLDATTIVLGDKTGNGTPTLNATLTQGGGTVKANTVTFGRDAGAGATPVLRPTYNLNGGTLLAGSISGGAGAFNNATSIRNLNVNGGTIRNYDAATSLVIAGVDGTAGGRLNVIAGAAGATFIADADRTITVAATAPITGAGTVTKDGAGRLLLDGSVAAPVAVVGGSVGGGGTLDGGVQVAAAGTIAPGNSIGTLSAASATIAGTLASELDGAGVGSSDLLAVGGVLDITGATLSLSIVDGGAPLDDPAYVLASYGSLTGAFSSVLGLPDGYEVDYAFNDGIDANQIALVAAVPVPEPAGIATALFGVAVGLFARRRRSA